MKKKRDFNQEFEGKMVSDNKSETNSGTLKLQVLGDANYFETGKVNQNDKTVGSVT